MNLFVLLCLIFVGSFTKCSDAENAIKETRDQKLADELYAACEDADLPKIIELLKRGADPNKPSIHGDSAFIRTCKECGHRWSKKSHERCLDNCRLLIINHFIAAGASVTMVSKSGKSPLSHAADHAELAVIKRLVEEGAQVNAKDRGSFWNAVDENHDPSVLEFLISQGRNLCPIEEYTKNFYLGTLAQKYGHLFWLQSHQPTVEIQPEEFSALHEKIVLLGELNKFMENPDLCIKTHNSDRSLRRFLFISIARMNEKSYRQIQGLKPEWFSRPTVIYKLLLHAALVGNVCVVKELMDRLKEMGMKCKPIVALMVMKYLSFTVEETPVLWQIATENL